VGEAFLPYFTYAYNYVTTMASAYHSLLY
jgi:hypothetical protein